jgi:branched-chain amino acid aminotransferase
MTSTAWFDGELVPVEGARLSLVDHAFTVGDAVFETMKLVDGVPFALSRHLRRLGSSAAGLGLPVPDESVVRAAVAAVTSRPDVPAAARVRITYGGGVAPMGSGRGDTPPHLAVVVGAVAPWDAVTRIVTVPWVRNERSAVAGLKTTSYAENVVAVEHAHRHGASEAIFANTRDELCEGTGSNVFVVKDGAILTPPLSSGCLAGVTRDLVLEWCDAKEATLSMHDLATADEVFLTSSTRDVHPVSAVDGRALAGAPGPLTQAAASEFARRAAQQVDP